MDVASFCPQLWDGCYINRSGEVFACCHTKPNPYGNIHKAPPSELINSPTALRLRTESLAGSLSCHTACNLLDKNIVVSVGTEEARIEYSGLKRLHISFGEACNIRYVMCDNPQRHAKNPILLDPEVIIRNVDRVKYDTLSERIKKHIRESNIFGVGQSGEQAYAHDSRSNGIHAFASAGNL
jgi:hypothetical protein